MKRLLLAALVTSVLSANSHAGDDVPHTLKGAIKFGSCEKPHYPEAAFKERRSGTVNAMFKVSAEGAVVQSRISKSSGHRDLDRAVQDALAKCAFTPAFVNGKPAESWVPLQYVWQLE